MSEAKYAAAVAAAPKASAAPTAAAPAPAAPAPVPTAAAAAAEPLDLSLLSEVFEELDDQTRLMEAECGVSVSSGSGSAQELKSVNGLIERVRRAALQIEIAREKGVRMIQNEAEEAKQIARALGDNLERLKEEVSSKRHDSDSDLTKSKAAYEQLHKSHTELAAAKQAVSDQLTALQKQYDQLNETLRTTQTTNTENVGQLTAKVAALQKEVTPPAATAMCDMCGPDLSCCDGPRYQLDDEYQTRQSEADSHLVAVAEIEKRYEKSSADAKTALQTAQTELATKHTKIATLEKSVAELTTMNQVLTARSDEQRKAIDTERTLRAAELAAVEKRLALANERNQLIAQSVLVSLAPVTVTQPTPTATLSQYKTDLMSALGDSKSSFASGSVDTFMTAIPSSAAGSGGGGSSGSRGPTKTEILYLTAALPAPNEINSVTTLQKLITSLQSELAIMKAALDKSKRSGEVLESINKELNDKRELDFKQLTADYKAQRVKFGAERSKYSELEQKQTAHLNQLQSTITDLHDRFIKRSATSADSKSDGTTTSGSSGGGGSGGDESTPLSANEFQTVCVGADLLMMVCSVI